MTSASVLCESRKGGWAADGQVRLPSEDSRPSPQQDLIPLGAAGMRLTPPEDFLEAAFCFTRAIPARPKLTDLSPWGSHTIGRWLGDAAGAADGGRRGEGGGLCGSAEPRRGPGYEAATRVLQAQHRIVVLLARVGSKVSGLGRSKRCLDEVGGPAAD